MHWLRPPDCWLLRRLTAQLACKVFSSPSILCRELEPWLSKAAWKSGSRTHQTTQKLYGLVGSHVSLGCSLDNVTPHSRVFKRDGLELLSSCQQHVNSSQESEAPQFSKAKNQRHRSCALSADHVHWAACAQQVPRLMGLMSGPWKDLWWALVSPSGHENHRLSPCLPVAYHHRL